MKLSSEPYSVDGAALVIRIVFCGLMVYNHWFMHLSLFSESPDSFPDPLGIGAVATYYIVIISEGLCATFVLLGLFTRWALLPLLAVMLVATVQVHWNNSMSEKELPLLYLAVFATIWLLGPGKYSLDAQVLKR